MRHIERGVFMKPSCIAAALTLVLATLAVNQEANAKLTQLHEGQVLNVIQDEEGTNIVMKVGEAFKSIYVPRSNKNESITQKAFEALRTKRNFKVMM